MVAKKTGIDSPKPSITLPDRQAISVTVPYGIKEHVQIVEDVLPSQADRDLVFWKTSNRIFRLGLPDSDPVASALVTV